MKYGGGRFEIPLQFWRDKTDVPFDVPDAFASASSFSKQVNFIGISLWVVAGKQAQQGRLAGAIRAL